MDLNLQREVDEAVMPHVARVIKKSSILKAGALVVLLTFLSAFLQAKLLHAPYHESCSPAVTTAGGEPRMWRGLGMTAGMAAEIERDFHYAQAQPNGSSCVFVPHSIPAKEEVKFRSTRADRTCNQDEACILQFERVCLTRKDPEVPIWNTSSFDYGQPSLELSQLPSECVELQKRAELFGGGSCGRMGKRLPLRLLSDSVGGVESNASWKPSTFIIYCAQEGCDYNFFHSIALAYYPTYVALQKLGLRNLEGIHIEFYECQAGKPNEVKSPEMIAAARERHSMFLQAFEPASISFIDIGLQRGVQHLGCYERVVFMGQNEWPWHCKTSDTEQDPLLTGFAKFTSEGLGFRGPAKLPQEDHLLYFKRENMVRTILNSEEVEAAFPVDYSVHLGTQPTQSYQNQLIEIITKARAASIIFGMHGAGLTNAIFAPQNAVVIEVTNCFWRVPLYRNLAVLTGKFYIELVIDVDDACKSLGPDEITNLDYHGNHVTVQLNDLASVLDQAQINLQRVRDTLGQRLDVSH